MSDSHVEAVIEKHRARAARGLEKYGTTLERDDLNFAQWLDHAQEEAMDFAVYLERIKACPPIDFARRVRVENALLGYAKRGESCPPDKCKELALDLGVPEEFRHA